MCPYMGLFACYQLAIEAERMEVSPRRISSNFFLRNINGDDYDARATGMGQVAGVFFAFCGFLSTDKHICDI